MTDLGPSGLQFPESALGCLFQGNAQVAWMAAPGLLSTGPGAPHSCWDGSFPDGTDRVTLRDS